MKNWFNIITDFVNSLLTGVRFNAVNYAAALKTTRMNAVVSAIDIDASPAYIEILGANGTDVLAVITLADPSFTVSGDIATMDAPKSDTDANMSGTATTAKIKTGAGAVIVSGLTVGAGSGDISLNTTTITIHQTVTLTAGSITHAT